MAADTQFLRKRKGIRFGLQIHFVELVLIERFEEMFRAPAIVATNKRFK